MVQTYRKFDRFRGRSAFAVDQDNFNAYNVNKWILTGTGTPAAALGANGGLDITTTAAGADKSFIQRGVETAATKLANLQFRKGKKFCLVARVEHADFNGFGVFFGASLPATNPDGTSQAQIVINQGGTTVFFGARNFQNPDLTLASLRDKFGGVDLEIYWDGQRAIHFFAGGQRVGGFKVKPEDFNATTGLLTALASNYAVTLGVMNNNVATARTVNVKLLGHAIQLKPDLGVAV